MIHLSWETEALARRLALAKGIPLEDAVRNAIEHSAREAGVLGKPQIQRDQSPEAIAARKARMDKIADEIANLPVLDPRSPAEIMDDLNVL